MALRNQAYASRESWARIAERYEALYLELAGSA
jgi:glycogen synthase